MTEKLFIPPQETTAETIKLEEQKKRENRNQILNSKQTINQAVIMI